MIIKWPFVLLLALYIHEGYSLSNPASHTDASDHAPYHHTEEHGQNPLRSSFKNNPKSHPYSTIHTGGLNPFLFDRASEKDLESSAGQSRLALPAATLGILSGQKAGNRFDYALDKKANNGVVEGTHLSSSEAVMKKDNDPLSLSIKDKTGYPLKNSNVLGAFATLPPPSQKKGNDEKKSGPNPDGSPFNFVSPTAFAAHDPRFSSTFRQYNNNQYSQGGQQRHPPQPPGYNPTHNQQNLISSNSIHSTALPSTFIIHSFPNKENPEFNIIEDISQNFPQQASRPHRRPSLAPHRGPGPTVTQSLFVQAPDQSVPSQQHFPGGEGPILIGGGQPLPNPHGLGFSGSNTIGQQSHTRPHISTSSSFSNFDGGQNINYGGTIHHHQQHQQQQQPPTNFAFQPNDYQSDLNTNQKKYFETRIPFSRHPTTLTPRPSPIPQVTHFPSIGNRIKRPSQYRPGTNIHSSQFRPHPTTIQPSSVSSQPSFTRLVVLSTTPEPGSKGSSGSVQNQLLNSYSHTNLHSKIPVTQTRPQVISHSGHQNFASFSQRPQGESHRRRPQNLHSSFKPHHSNEEGWPPKEYSYGYAVDDRLTGDQKSAYETSGPDGVVQGRYTVVQPDGLFRVVTYTADKENGFRAKVDYLPTVSVKGKSIEANNKT